MIIAAIIWLVDDTQYPWLVQKILSDFGFLFILGVTTFFLCNYALQKSIDKNKMAFFMFQFILTSIFQSVILWLFDEGLFHLEAKGIFPDSGAEKESLSSAVLATLPLTILVNLGFCGLKSYCEHVKLHEQYLELQKAHLETRLQALQSQINPHFMFNVLNHIYMLIRKDTDLASSLLIKYSEILRYQLYSIKREYISLEQEIQFLGNYIDVEKSRWKNMLDVNCRWRVENTKKELPPLLLITFVENAFKHVSRSKAQKGYINIDFEQKDGIICLKIENSRSTANNRKDEDSGLGLENIKKRLDILYGDNYSLSINKTGTAYHTELVIKK
jgi:hypothetical protein